MRKGLRSEAWLMGMIMVVTAGLAAAQSPKPQDNAAASAQVQSVAAASLQHDQEPNPEDRQLEQIIRTAFQQDPKMADSRITVHATDKEIVLSGVVVSSEAKQEAVSIAEQHADGRKVANKIKVNPNIHPGPGR